MSDHDLDLYQAGQIQPWEPSQPLAPSPADDWGNTDYGVDYLQEHRLSPSSHGLPAHVEQNLAQITGIFYSDLGQLGHPLAHIEAAANWFKKTLANPPTSMPTRRSRFELYQYRGDLFMEHFANFAATIGMSQEMMQTICYWCGELEKKLDAASYQGTPPAQGSATYSQDSTDSLSDSDFERVQQINMQAQSNTVAYLQKKWGQSYLANMNTLTAYFQALPIGEQEFLNQYDRNWVNGLNSAAVLEGLFRNAIGAGSLPSGGGVQAEIASIENLMRTNSKAYRSDNRIQARLRVLYGLRDGN